MNCTDCTAAAEKSHHGFAAECAGCRARAVARSIKFSEAVKTGVQSRDYRRVLDQCGVTHDEVKAAAVADRGCDKLLRVVP